MNNFFKTKFFDKEYLLYLLDVLLKRPNVANGLLPDVVKEEDYVYDPVFGADEKVLLTSKNWKPYRSTGEEQKRPNSSETMACTIYSSLNGCEAIMNRMKAMVANEEADEETQELVKVFNYFEFYNDKGEADLSDPFTAKMSGTSYRGNTYENVCYSMRHDGLVAEKYWQTPDKYTWDEYYKTIPQDVKNRGKLFTDYVEVIYKRFTDFSDVKQYCPITGSVYADGNWNSDGIKQRPNQAHNHSILNDNDEPTYNEIFDSYIPFNKKVAKNYGMGAGRMIIFKLKKPLEADKRVSEFIAKYDGKTVKGLNSPKIYHIQGGKKKWYPNELSYVIWNETPIITFEAVDDYLLNQVPDGDIMDIEKSPHWNVIKALAKPYTINQLLETLKGADVPKL